MKKSLLTRFVLMGLIGAGLLLPATGHAMSLYEQEKAAIPADKPLLQIHPDMFTHRMEKSGLTVDAKEVAQKVLSPVNVLPTRTVYTYPASFWRATPNRFANTYDFASPDHLILLDTVPIPTGRLTHHGFTSGTYHIYVLSNTLRGSVQKTNSLEESPVLTGDLWIVSTFGATTPEGKPVMWTAPRIALMNFTLPVDKEHYDYVTNTYTHFPTYKKDWALTKEYVKSLNFGPIVQAAVQHMQERGMTEYKKPDMTEPTVLRDRADLGQAIQPHVQLMYHLKAGDKTYLVPLETLHLNRAPQGINDNDTYLAMELHLIEKLGPMASRKEDSLCKVYLSKSDFERLIKDHKYDYLDVLLPQIQQALAKHDGETKAIPNKAFVRSVQVTY